MKSKSRKLKKFLHTIANMSEIAYTSLRGTLMVACTMVFCALVVVLFAGHYSTATYDLYRLAKELSSAPAGLLLISVLFSAIAEDYFRV